MESKEKKRWERTLHIEVDYVDSGLILMKSKVGKKDNNLG